MIGHRIEQHAKVYLYFEDGQWQVDHITFDGHPLDGLEDGATPGASDCECDGPEGCQAAHDAANRVPLPTGDELLTLMNEASF